MTYIHEQARIQIPPGIDHHQANIVPALNEMSAKGWEVMGNPLPMGTTPRIQGARPELFWLVFIRKPKPVEVERESSVLVEG